MIFIEELTKNMNKKDDKKYKLQKRYDEIKQQIDEIENEMKNDSQEYIRLKTQSIEFIGEDGFKVLCPDIDSNPDKYSNQKGQIKILAELRIKIKKQQENIDKLLQEIEVLQKSINQPDITSSHIIQEIKMIRMQNGKLIEKNINVETKINNLQNEIEDLKKQLEVKKQEIISEYEQNKKIRMNENNSKIDELKKQMESYKSGNINL